MSANALEAVTLWRCTKCHKWSHAVRRPSSHKRYIRSVENDGTEYGADVPATAIADRSGLRVLSVVEPTSGTEWRPIAGEEHRMEPYDDWYDPGGVWVACGPFEPWTATRLLSEHSTEQEAS
jgi:hypothetical protein